MSPKTSIQHPESVLGRRSGVNGLSTRRNHGNVNRPASSLQPGSCSLVPAPWLLQTGSCSLVPAPWLLQPGSCSLEKQVSVWQLRPTPSMLSRVPSRADAHCTAPPSHFASERGLSDGDQGQHIQRTPHFGERSGEEGATASACT